MAPCQPSPGRERGFLLARSGLARCGCLLCSVGSRRGPVGPPRLFHSAGRHRAGHPANLVDDPGTARPEWSFRGLYQLHETLSGWPEMVSIFVIPGLTVLVFFAMPWIGRNVVGRTLNIAVTLFVLGGLSRPLLAVVRARREERQVSACAQGRPGTG